jgi:hypothetical protein
MTVEQHVFGMLLFFILSVWGFRKMLRDIDTDGTVKDAARKGIVTIIGRLFR